MVKRTYYKTAILLLALLLGLTAPEVAAEDVTISINSDKAKAGASSHGKGKKKFHENVLS
mgnify:CR=1 FL=1